MVQKLKYVSLPLAAALSILIGCSQPPTDAKESNKESNQQSTVGQSLSDVTTTASVKMALVFTRGVKASDIHVSTRWGTVTLQGEVHTQAEKQLATKTAQDTDGVKEVVNKLEVRG